MAASKTNYLRLATEWKNVADKLKAVGIAGDLAKYLREHCKVDSKKKGTGDKRGSGGYADYVRCVTKHTEARKAGSDAEAVTWAEKQVAIYTEKEKVSQETGSTNIQVDATRSKGVAGDKIKVPSAKPLGAIMGLLAALETIAADKADSPDNERSRKVATDALARYNELMNKRKEKAAARKKQGDADAEHLEGKEESEESDEAEEEKEESEEETPVTKVEETLDEEEDEVMVPLPNAVPVIMDAPKPPAAAPAPAQPRRLVISGAKCVTCNQIRHKSTLKDGECRGCRKTI